MGNFVHGQNSNPCNLHKNTGIYAVNSSDIDCLAKNNKKEFLIIYTFGIWCAPCIQHLPNALNLEDNYNANVYVLLIDEENDKNLIERTVTYLESQKEDVDILILKDSYGKNKNKKYKKFLKEITPEKFENINDMSKYIVFDKAGEVLMVTTWKDNRNYDWKDDSNMIKEKIIPIIQ